MATIAIPLTQGKVAIIDEADYALVSGYRWHTLTSPDERCYAASTQPRVDGKQAVILMHRLILDTAPGEEVDHHDLNTMNNTRENLRCATRSQNMANRRAFRSSVSGYKGVSYRSDRQLRPWQAIIGAEGDRQALGAYETAEDAAEAYNRAALERHGEFARLNIVDRANPLPRPTPKPERKQRAPGASGFRGVSYNKKLAKYAAYIDRGGKRTRLGFFATAEEAARARADAERAATSD